MDALMTVAGLSIGVPSLSSARSTRSRDRVVAMAQPAAEDMSAVMSRVAAGDQAAFAIFYDETSSTVFGIVLRVLRDHAQAEEVAQEVFLEAWRTSARYDAKQGTPAAWINTIAHRRAVDRVRSVERSVKRDLRHAETENLVDAPDVSDLVVARDEGGRVRRALAALPEAQRTALALAYYDGHTQSEVADMLNVPLGTVKTRMRDAMKKLRGYLDEGGPS
jgi:RNA polymerase sigma-70 factor (ECF subfamily)